MPIILMRNEYPKYFQDSCDSFSSRIQLVEFSTGLSSPIEANRLASTLGVEARERKSGREEYVKACEECLDLQFLSERIGCSLPTISKHSSAKSQASRESFFEKSFLLRDKETVNKGYGPVLLLPP